MSPENPITIRLEQPADREAIHRVHHQAFGQAEEAQLVDKLRDAGLIKASLVAIKDDQIVGHILFSALPIETADGIINALALAPMAVLPDHQSTGIGSKLVQQGLDTCRQMGHAIVIVLGHPKFYPKFGFSCDLTQSLDAPFSGDAFMAVELVPGAMDGIAGTVKYPEPFDAL